MRGFLLWCLFGLWCSAASAQDPHLLAGLPHRGAAPGTGVVLLEVSDFQCPFCARLSPTLDRVMETWGGRVTHYYLDYPLDFHKKAFKAHEAAACAHRQGRFWDMYGRIFAQQSSLEPSDLLAHGAILGLDRTRLESCLTRGDTKHLIGQRRAFAKELGVTGTPTVFINGEPVSGSRPFEDFDVAIRKALGGTVVERPTPR